MNIDLRLIRDRGAIAALNSELKDSLRDIKTASEKAGNTLEQTFENLPHEIKKIEVLCEHIKFICADIERIRSRYTDNTKEIS